jgi:hypothetical protein
MTYFRKSHFATTCLGLTFVTLGLFSACDKVENPIPTIAQGDWALYPNGDSAHYAANAWPTFTTNANTDRNVLIEDFTGHKCKYCPIAADSAHQAQVDHLGRVLVASIHTGPSGFMEDLQKPVLGAYFNDFTSTEGFAIGYKFGAGTAGSPFNVNPFGAVSRVDHGNGYVVTHPNAWSSAVNSMIAANDLKVNLQAASNYYSSTRGLFLHTEVDVLDQTLTNDLSIVVCLIEDSLVAAQTMPDNGTNLTYVHRDIFRGCIDGKPFGQELDAAHMTAAGTYEYFYIYKLPATYNPDNVHIIIYVRDAVTEEIYQVIKHKF